MALLFPLVTPASFPHLNVPATFPGAHRVTVGIKGVVNDPLGRVKFVIVFEAQVSKTFSDCLKPWTFGLIPEGIVGVSSIDDFTEQY